VIPIPNNENLLGMLFLKNKVQMGRKTTKNRKQHKNYLCGRISNNIEI